MRRHVLFCTAGLLLAGCHPLVTSEPLSPVEEAEPDTELLGTWREVDFEESANAVVMRIDRPTRRDGGMRLSYLSERQPLPLRWTLHASASRGCTYANVHIASDDETGFWIARYEVDGDRLRIWSTPAQGEIQSGIRSGDLRGTVQGEPEDEAVRVNAPYELETQGEELLSWLVEHDDDVFPPDEANEFERIPWPSPWPRRPAEWAVLAGAFAIGVVVGLVVVRRRRSNGTAP